MTTPEVAAQLSKTEPLDQEVGPVHNSEEDPSQSLLDKHRKMSVNFTSPTDKPSEDPGQQEPADTKTRKDRVMSTGARTPNSLLVEIEARVAANAEKEESREQSEEKKIGDEAAKSAAEEPS